MASVEISYVNDGVVNRPRSLVKWTAMATAVANSALTVAGQLGLVGAAQISGTFGGATVTLQCSNDGTTWFDMSDVSGTVMTATGNSFFEFSTAALYIKPLISGGTNDDVDVTLVLRG